LTKRLLKSYHDITSAQQSLSGHYSMVSAALNSLEQSESVEKILFKGGWQTVLFAMK